MSDVNNPFARIQSHLDEMGCVTKWPSRRQKEKQQLVLEYLLQFFDADKQYTEKEVNELLNAYHHFKDPALLRREMFVRKLLNRTIDGRAYWVAKTV